MARTGILIDNQWRASESGRTIAVLAPATGEEFTRIAAATSVDVDAAVKRCDAAPSRLARGEG